MQMAVTLTSLRGCWNRKPFASTVTSQLKENPEYLTFKR